MSSLDDVARSKSSKGNKFSFEAEKQTVVGKGGSVRQRKVLRDNIQ
eukprot:CAMPEP_0194501124 /NCGR_PEP_ID=MMETSP0253-20130528/21443_1 /TAXON_ID=2966 /ORGANISM="Noctiluca scintillans" /LENGTH=45 /DNA_ID= /DNA_START= /DNA_END= /DNA_ORIENTATION=